MQKQRLGVSNLKIESAVFVVLTICVFLSFYFTFLSFQMTDDFMKKQVLTLAVFSLVTGIVIFACMAVYWGIKSVFPKVEIH